MVKNHFRNLYITVGLHECQNVVPRPKESTNDKQTKASGKIFTKISF